MKPLYTVGRTVKWCNFNEKDTAASPQTDKIITLSRNPTSGYISQRMKTGSQRGICSPIFITILFSVAKRWKLLKCPLVDEWINKMWYIHIREYYPTVADFIFLGSKITADGDSSHKIKRCLLLERKVMTNLDSILKSILLCQQRSI